MFVEQARERTRTLGSIRIDEGDACSLPYPDGSFDAAHCERVLMHLADPGEALNEMRRVVRPGGRIVAAEPDWASMVIDSTEHEIMRLLMQQAISRIRQPRVGRELNRRLAAAGLVDRRIEVVPVLSLDYAELVTYGLHLSEALDVLAAEGRLDREQGQAVLDELADANTNGTFCAFAGSFVAYGRSPIPKAE